MKNYRTVKRTLDFIFSFALLSVFLPLLVSLALVALVTHGRPIFFVQVRPGLNSEPFKLLKFRTMKSSFPSRSGRVPTLTKYGRFLRFTSLDELPQLLNILKGDMSFVGPRPLLMEYLPLYSDAQSQRHTVLPGLTGLAQVSGRNGLSWSEKLNLDVVYARRASFRLDLWVVCRTFHVVLSQTGVVTARGEIPEKFSG